MNNRLLHCFLALAALVLAGCQSPRIAEVSDKYSPGNEGSVTASILGNARQREGKITNKERTILQTVGPIHFNELLAKISSAPKLSTLGEHTIGNLKQLKTQALELNSRLITLLQGYQSKEPELTQEYEISHRECCARLSREILDQINNGNAKQAENTWLMIDSELEQQQRASIVSALSVKHAKSITQNTYEAALLTSTFLANETVKAELPNNRYAELVDRLTVAVLAQPEGDRKDALKKLELFETAQNKCATKMSEATKLKIAASISDLQDKLLIRIHLVDTFNKSEHSIRDFNTALTNKLRSLFSSLSPCFTRVEKLTEDLSTQTMGNTSFETLGACLRALKPIPNTNRRLLLLTEVKSVRVEREPRDREILRIEEFTSDTTLFDAFREGFRTSGMVSHYECVKETQLAQVAASVDVILYDISTGKVVFRETVDPQKRFSSVNISNPMMVGQDAIRVGGRSQGVGPLKQVPVSNPPRHVQAVMNLSTGPLPSNSAMVQEIFGMSVSLIAEKLESYLRAAN